MAEVEPQFLGYGAFETTAFLTAILVACYSLISNPKGRQNANNQSEFQVYTGWRLAILVIFTQIVLIVIVLATVARQPGIDSKPVVWVAMLMLAPWAPLAGRVRQTLSSAPRVRQMMLQRVTRNELAAIIRDRFKFGQRGIALPVVLFHAEGTVPPHPTAALQANTELAPYEQELRKYADEATQTEASVGYSLDLGSLWMMNQSQQPSAIRSHEYVLWRAATVIDPLARLWTKPSVQLHTDPMPEQKRLRTRARILDITDMLQQGGTISDSLMMRAMGSGYCERCRLATRGAVESYLESSERGHTDLRASKWLKHIGADWRGRYERVIDVMWEACFMEGSGEKVEYDDADASPSFGDRQKVTTTKTLTLLWLIMRSLVHRDDEHINYSKIATIVAAGPYTRTWWDRFWHTLASKLTTAPNNVQVNKRTSSKFKETLRDLVDEDMLAIVSIICSAPMESNLCSDEGCRVSEACILMKNYSIP